MTFDPINYKKIKDLQSQTIEQNKQIYDFLYRLGSVFDDKIGGFIESYKKNTVSNSYSMETDYIDMSFTYSGGTADLGVGTDQPIDVTDIDTLYIDWEQKVDNDSIRGVLLASQYRTQPYAISDASIKLNGFFNRQTTSLDVSGLSGEKYVRVHAYSNNSSGQSDLRVYSIYADTPRPFVSDLNKVIDKFKHGNSVYAVNMNREKIIDFDFKNGKIVVPQEFRTVYQNNVHTNQNAYELSLSGATFWILFLNTQTEKLEIKNSGDLDNLEEYHLLFGIVYTSTETVICDVDSYKVNGILSDLPKKLPEQYRTPVESFDIRISQDGTVVGDEVWSLIASDSTAADSGTIKKYDKTTFAEKSTITHDMGHGNNVDYKEGTLLVVAGMSELNLHSDPTKSHLSPTDAENTTITFATSSKGIADFGSPCFGDNKQTIYYATPFNGENMRVHRMTLGMGDNDLSDKSTNQDDVMHWGTFTSGKSESEYNGTAKVEKVYEGYIGSEYSPHGLFYGSDGFLYMATGFQSIHLYKIKLNDDGTLKVVGDYRQRNVNYRNEPVNEEPQMAFEIDGFVYVGGNIPSQNLFKFRR